MFKLTTLVPKQEADNVRDALARSGAGSISCYDYGSFSSIGTSRFRPLEGADPSAGEIGKIYVSEEERIETEFTAPKAVSVIKSLVQAHPYEAPAIYISPLIDYRTFLSKPLEPHNNDVNDAVSTISSFIPSTSSFSVSVEGIPGVGKTSVCQLLATILNADLIRRRSSILHNFKEWCLSQHNEDVHRTYDTMTYFLLGDEMIQRTMQGKCVIIDEYYASHIAHRHSAQGLAGSEEAIDWPELLPRPTFVILLTLAPSIQLKRTQYYVAHTDQRNNDHNNDNNNDQNSNSNIKENNHSNLYNSNSTSESYNRVCVDTSIVENEMLEGHTECFNNICRNLGCLEINAAGSVTDTVTRIIARMSLKFPELLNYLTIKK